MKSIAIKILILSVVVCTLFGCGNSYIRKHPDLPEEIKEAIKNHVVMRGMDKEQAVASVGRGPDLKLDLNGDPIQEGDEPYSQVWHWYAEETEMKLRREEYQGSGIGIAFSFGSERTGKAKQFSVYFNGDTVLGVRESRGYMLPGGNFFETPEMLWNRQ